MSDKFLDRIEERGRQKGIETPGWRILIMKYPFYTYIDEVEGHTFWVAKSLSLKGCLGQGDTEADAISELAVNENDWLEEAGEFGIAIPKA